MIKWIYEIQRNPEWITYDVPQTLHMLPYIKGSQLDLVYNYSVICLLEFNIQQPFSDYNILRKLDEKSDDIRIRPRE